MRNITKDWNVVRDYIDSKAFYPYFFSFPGFFGGEKVLIVNVRDGKLETALYVGDVWRKEGRNAGYKVSIPEDVDISLLKSKARITRENGYVKGAEGDSALDVLLYEDGSYSAVLFG